MQLSYFHFPISHFPISYMQLSYFSLSHFVLQFATNASKPWPYSQSTMAPPWTELAPQMLIAARVYDEPRYEHMIKQLPWPGGKHWPQQKSWDVDVSRLLFPSHIPDDEVR